MSRLRRQWGVQSQHILTGEWLGPNWYVSRDAAEAFIEFFFKETGDTSKVRLVTRVTSELEIVSMQLTTN